MRWTFKNIVLCVVQHLYTYPLWATLFDFQKVLRNLQTCVLAVQYNWCLLQVRYWLDTWLVLSARMGIGCTSCWSSSLPSFMFSCIRTNSANVWHLHLVLFSRTLLLLLLGVELWDHNINWFIQGWFSHWHIDLHMPLVRRMCTIGYHHI